MEKGLPIEIDPRVLIKNARALVSDTPIYALVELITNSDDSYSRMERSGKKVSGLIHIEIVRKREGSVFRVIDQAEGMDRKQMDERVARYGGRTSGREGSRGVRGQLGRGLKEAMVGTGYGKLRSIKEGYLYECAVDSEARYYPEEPVKVTPRIRGELGVLENGTEVVLRADNPNIRIPQFEKLKEFLSKYFSLRNILQDPSRVIQLVERTDRGGRKRLPELISYISPEGTKIYEGPIEVPYMGQKVSAKISVWRAAGRPLSNKEEAGDCRENGLLISDGKAIHDITLFKFDNTAEAQRLFGEVTCEYIYQLLDEDEEVISDKRDELNYRHPFIKALKQSVEVALEPLVKKERELEESEKREIETRETKERFTKLLAELSEIEKELLGKVLGPGKRGDKGTVIPENGFAFIPPATTVVNGKEKTLTLRALVPHAIPLDSEISVTSELAGIGVKTPTLKFEEADLIGEGVASKTVKIEGKQSGAMGMVVAQFGELRADCLIEVVSKSDDDDGGEKPEQRRRGGLFSGFELKAEDPRRRAWFDDATGIVSININAPSVAMYVGPSGERQHERYSRVLIAELVTDIICLELAKEIVKRGEYTLSNIPESIEVQKRKLVNAYSEKFHRILAS